MIRIKSEILFPHSQDLVNAFMYDYNRGDIVEEAVIGTCLLLLGLRSRREKENMFPIFISMTNSHILQTKYFRMPSHTNRDKT